MKNEEKILKLLIKEEVKRQLNETQRLNEDQLLFTKLFIEPFVDIGKTAIAGIKKTGAAAFSNIKSLAGQTAIALLPFISTKEMDRFKKSENDKLKNHIANVDQEYADVLNRTAEALQSQNFSTIRFLANPSEFIAFSLAQKAPGLALDLLSILTGGMQAITDLKSQYEASQNKSYQGSSDNQQYYAGQNVGGFEGGYYEGANSNKSRLLENSAQNISQLIKQLSQNPQIQQKINSNPIFSELRKSTIDSVLERARTVAGFKTYEQFKTFVGPDFANFEKNVNSSLPKDATGENIKKLQQEQVVTFKKAYHKIFNNYLNGLQKQNPKLSQEIEKALKELSKILP